MAKDEDGTIHFFKEKPSKGEHCWEPYEDRHEYYSLLLNDSVHWEDEKPMEILFILGYLKGLSETLDEFINRKNFSVIK